MVPATIEAQQQPDVDSLVQEVRSLKAQLDALTGNIEVLDQQGDAAAGRRAPDQRLRMTSGIQNRPFVYRGGGTAVGGYVDLEFSANFDGDRTTFRQHRLIPFIFAEINDRIHFGTEIEFEDGGPNGAADDGEVKVEFAALDVMASEGLNFRAGALLTPLGKFNLTHDSPVNDLTDRPLVDRLVIPTTFTEAGAGVFGTLFPSEQSVLTYEAYIVNGFDNDLVRYSTSVVGGGTVSLAPSLNVRSARGSLKRDNNQSKALTGRVGFSPLLGVELGLSGHTGRYGNSGDGRFSIVALDGIFTRGRFEFLGELARSSLSVDRIAEAARARPAFDAAADAAGLPATGRDAAFQSSFAAAAFPTGQLGYFAQLNYHFGQDLLGAFPQSTFTGVVRYGRVDNNRAVTGDHLERFTVGVNLRLIEQTVIKVAHQWNWSTAAGSSDRGAASKSIVASVASYF